MASVVCNVYDENENAVDCKYQGFHYETGNWSNVHDTENQQISFDTNDDDWDNEGVAVPEGDTLLIVAWIDSEDRAGQHSKMSVMKIASTGDSLYTLDIQLRPCSSCVGSVTPSSVLVGADSVVGLQINQEYQWDYKGNTFYLKNSWYGQSIFNLDGSGLQVKIDGTWYDAPKEYVFNTAGEYTVEWKYTGICGNECSGSDTLTVANNAPTTTVEIDKNDYLLHDTVVFTVTNNDPDSAVVKQTWYVNNVEVTENKFQLDTLDGYEIRIVTEWDNGTTTESYNTIRGVQARNRPPTTGIGYELVDKEYKFTLDSIDPEGMMGYNMIDIYIDKVYVLDSDRDKDPEWVLAREQQIANNSFTTRFYTIGRYKVCNTAYDQQGLHSDEVCTTVVIDTCGDAETKEVAVYLKDYVISGDLSQLGTVSVTDFHGDAEIVNVFGEMYEENIDGNAIELSTTADGGEE